MEFRAYHMRLKKDMITQYVKVHKDEKMWQIGSFSW